MVAASSRVCSLPGDFPAFGTKYVSFKQIVELLAVVSGLTSTLKWVNRTFDPLFFRFYHEFMREKYRIERAFFPWIRLSGKGDL